MNAIDIRNLGKAFRTYPSGRHRIMSWLGFRVSGVEEQWVLRNISFQAQPGEAVGLVGENGAGKSTLLKMIAGTMVPSEGEVHLDGDVRAILELGMGFQGEFTGRENSRHGLSMMGLDSGQVEALLPQVEDFAEVGDYFDRPLRTYSSGMQMRVTFAVATVRRPEVLIVDEALSVGDAYFQHKSFDRIRAMQQAGTTLLIVSHDRGAIQRICDRVVLLEQGHVSQEGPPEAVMDYYNAMLANKGNREHRVQTRPLEDGRIATTSGTGEAEVTEVALLDAAERSPVEVARVGQALILAVTVKVNEPLPELVVGYVLKNRLRQEIFGTNTFQLNQVVEDAKPGETLSYQFHFECRLGEGSYSLSVAAHTGEAHVERNYHWQDLAYTFEVVNVNLHRFLGSAWLPPTLELTRTPAPQLTGSGQSA